MTAAFSSPSFWPAGSGRLRSKKFLQREHIQLFWDLKDYALPTIWQIDPKGWSPASIFELCDLAFLPVADGSGMAPDSSSGDLDLATEMPAGLHPHQAGRVCHLRDSTVCAK